MICRKDGKGTHINSIEETGELNMLHRVFNAIKDNYFNDHKMIAHYCNTVHFSRNLGDDIANWVHAYYPEYYYLYLRLCSYLPLHLRVGTIPLLYTLKNYRILRKIYFFPMLCV